MAIGSVGASPSRSTWLDAVTPWLVAAAVAAPMLTACSLPPTTTAFNQLAACATWGAASLAAGTSVRADVGVADVVSLRLPLAGVSLLAATAVSAWAGGLPTGLATSVLAVLSLAALTLVLGGAAAKLPALVLGFAWGCVVAGALSTVIAVIQVAAPAWPDGSWIARSPLPGRAVGNLRQPNHLAAVMILAAMALVPLAALGSWPRRFVYPGFAWMLLGLALTASRTAALGVAVIAMWGLGDRRLAAKWRWMLALSPVLLAAFWVCLDLGAMGTDGAFALASRLHEADVSGSRFGIWRNTLELMASHAWTGVGFGNFNLAWTLTPFPARPTAFFDHAHNLPLHLLSELGVPLGFFACTLLVAGLWLAGRRAWRSPAEQAILPRALFVMLLVTALHSLLEYPLWYAHLLLPAAFALGACASWPAPEAPAAYSGPRAMPRHRLPMAMAGLVAAAGSVYAAVDYLRVSSIFSDRPHAQSIEQRIAAGRRSLFFAHHADYARATTAEHPGEVMDSFDVAKYYLLDTRLMLAWARAYAERGDLDRARYIAERLREFRNPAPKDFFAACDGDPDPRPFQCDPPSGQLTWRDFAGKQ